MLTLFNRPLTTDEFFKIDKTALAEVLTEEPGFFHEAKEEAPLSSKAPKKNKERGGKNDGKEDDELGDLEKELEGLDVEEDQSDGDEETKRILKAIDAGENIMDTILDGMRLRITSSVPPYLPLISLTSLIIPASTHPHFLIAPAPSSAEVAHPDGQKTGLSFSPYLTDLEYAVFYGFDLIFDFLMF